MRKRFLLVSVTAVILTIAPSAFATVVDLVNNTQGTLAGALYIRSGFQPAGSGVIDSFVRINPGGSQDFAQGYNTDFRPLQYDENNSPTFTRSLNLSAVPIVNIPGGICATGCREFLLDINQNNSDQLLTLNRVVVSLRAAGNLAGATVVPGSRLGAAGGLFPEADTIVYDSGTANQIQLDANLQPGSGAGDMVLYIPTALFTGANPWVYLYSEFGSIEGDVQCGAPTNPMTACYANENGGFEEWAVQQATTVPEPTSLVLLGAGLIGLAVARKRI